MNKETETEKSDCFAVQRFVETKGFSSSFSQVIANFLY